MSVLDTLNSLRWNQQVSGSAAGGTPPHKQRQQGGGMSPGVMGPYSTPTGHHAPTAHGLPLFPHYRLPPPNVPQLYGQYAPGNANYGGYGGGRGQGGPRGGGRGGQDSMKDAQLSSTNLYIRGLDQHVTDESLKQMCEGFGNIVSTKAILDKNTGLCKGYGFVDFDSSDAAEKAVKHLQEKNIQAQMAKVSEPQQEQDPTNLYIANLPPHWTEASLEGLLNPFGMVISTRILRSPDGKSRGVGFARMDAKEKCDQIIQKFNGKPLPGVTTEPLLVKFADSGKKPKRNQNPGFLGSGSPLDIQYAAAGIPNFSPDQMNGGGLTSPVLQASRPLYAGQYCLPGVFPAQQYPAAMLQQGLMQQQTFMPAGYAGNGVDPSAAGVSALANQLSSLSMDGSQPGGHHHTPVTSATAAAQAYQAAMAAQYAPQAHMLPTAYYPMAAYQNLQGVPDLSQAAANGGTPPQAHMYQDANGQHDHLYSQYHTATPAK